METFELRSPGILGLAPDELADWGEAHRRVAANLRAYGLRNPLVISDVTLRILQAAREQPGPGAPVERAAAELDRRFALWVGHLIQEDLPTAESRLIRGRLALWMSRAPERWPECFLAPPPYPEAFVEAMNQARLFVGPELLRLGMAPAPIRFHPVTEFAGDTLGNLARWPVVRLLLGGLLIAGLLIFLISIAR
ncbi:MAG: hypothetical protein JJT96_10280 [Opitutales bacterium]|nr:hypothetical protein [Opitutales bacterium]